MSIIFGLDLGQTKDLTALVGAEKTTDAKGLNHYAFRYLKRFLVGTPYTSAPDSKEPGVVEFTDNLLSGAPFAGADPVLAIDQTGVGRPVVDRFRATNRLNILPITVTAGNVASPATNEYGWHVPKKLLVTTVQVLLQSRRLTFAKQIPESAALVKELQNFKVKITLAANEQFACLTAGTMVETSTGPKPIELVKRDDDVLTGKGYNRVLWSGETKRVNEVCRVAFGNGSVLEGTPDHLVWTGNRGWVELARLTCQDLCFPIQRPSFSTASSTGVRQASNTTFVGSQKSPFIGRFGNTITVPFPADTTSTTPTRTPTITTYQILNALRTPNMLTGISSGRHQRRKRVRSAPRVLFVVEAGRLSAMIRESCFALFGAPISGESRDLLPAFNAEWILPVGAMDGTAKSSGFVPQCAAKHTATETEIENRGRAPDAKKISSQCTRSQNTVRVVAPPVIVRSSESVPVYDLSVEGEHEFFANGILVHNCWREGDHDDLVLAVAMACWVGENVVTGAFDVPRDPGARSAIEDAPDGCFLVDEKKDNEEPEEFDRP